MRGLALVFALALWGAGGLISPTPTYAAEPDAAPGHEQPPLTLVAFQAFFEAVVFGAETRNSRRTDTVLKWPGPDLPVDVEGFETGAGGRLRPVPVVKTHVAAVWQHLKALESLTGLRPVPPGKDAGPVRLTVVFTPRTLMARIPLPGVPGALKQELAAPGGCYFVSLADADGRLKRAFVVVNVERPADQIRHCLLEELVQAMGLPNDTSAFRPSIFSDHDRLHALTERDQWLVRALYDRRIQPGMTKKTAWKLLNAIYKDFVRRYTR